jgi:Glu-tRNA(Gln) amidotransferase subunit E-like FAD-binding protein
MLSREQTEALIDEMVSKLWITDLKTQRWMLMKELMANHKSELDGAIVNDIINSRL